MSSKALEDGSLTSLELASGRMEFFLGSKHGGTTLAFLKLRVRHLQIEHFARSDCFAVPLDGSEIKPSVGFNPSFSDIARLIP